MIKLAVIADDLTGANDTALQFAKRNIRSSVEIDFMNINSLLDKEVIVADTDSRDLDKLSAYNKVNKIFKKISNFDAECIYKKIDSTLRGNIGAEIKAISDEMNPDIVLIAPAYPSNGRQTIGGYHLLNGVPIERTEIANSPKTPVRTSYIPDILKEQVDKGVSLLDFNVLRKGKLEIRKFVSEAISNNKNWIVCDVIDNSDFITIMEAVKEYKNILWVGSAGLAEYLPLYYGWIGNRRYSLSKRQGSILVCAGSISHVTQDQVDVLLKSMDIDLVKINIIKLLENQSEELKDKQKIINEIISRNKNILLTTAQSDEDVELAMNIGKKHGLSSKEVSEKIANIMADLINSIDFNKLSGMILTGGDMAIHICKAINVSSIEIISEVDTGVPLGYIESKNLDKLFIVTKAGAFGKEDIFVKSIEAIKSLM